MIARTKFSPGKAYVLLVSVLLTITPCLAQAPQSVQWKSVNGHDPSFTAEMPSVPDYSEQAMKSLHGTGTAYTSHKYFIDQGSVAYIIMTANFPADVVVSVPKENIQSAIDGIAKSLNEGKWTSVSWVDHDGLVAVDALGIQGEVELRYYAVMKDSQFFSLIYGGPPGTAKTPDVDRFLHSLKIPK